MMDGHHTTHHTSPDHAGQTTKSSRSAMLLQIAVFPDGSFAVYCTFVTPTKNTPGTALVVCTHAHIQTEPNSHIALPHFFYLRFRSVMYCCYQRDRIIIIRCSWSWPCNDSSWKLWFCCYADVSWTIVNQW